MLNRRDFLKGAGASLGGYAFGATADRPNVVQILVDDMGFADLGWKIPGEPADRLEALKKLMPDQFRFTKDGHLEKKNPTKD